MLLTQLLLTLMTVTPCPEQNCGNEYSISGTVIDIESKQPVQGVNVFIAGSQSGSNSDSQGYFEINGIEIEAFQLVFSHVGYKIKNVDFDIRRSSKNLKIYLKPTSRELEAVTVNSKKDRKWERDLKKFKKFFFGEQHDKSLINIDNDYLIEFSERRGRGLWVENEPGLEITNDYLGYHIHFELLEFKLAKLKSYFGYSMFMPLETDSPETRQKWLENRKTAYNGSRRHFFKSLLTNTLEENGFAVSLLKNVNSMDFNRQLAPKREQVRLMDDGLNKKNIIVKKISLQTFELRFKGVMEVTYFDEFDEYGDPQSSEFTLNAPLLLNKNGVLLNPGVLVSSGFWTKEGMYEFLPSDYDPNEH